MTAAFVPASTTTVNSSKVRRRVVTGLSIVLGLFFIIASGGPKLVIPHVLMDNAPANLTIPLGLLLFIGVAEVAGGIGVMIPRLRALAAIGLAVLTVLAAATQAFIANAPGMAIFPLVLAAIFSWIAYESRASLPALLRR
ncbi:DoxX family protein [Nocardia camponoti]|uniref:DoxX family protein n=1 Tax=Nocardia camponoti TaxID=1616106 RepID=A0A917VDV6_9NOCA|nr:DoxX family protein [Nocardia camponoti]GGK67017.1 hypothetical protein GCM10011591_43950 [Nocardia camponoti]